MHTQIIAMDLCGPGFRSPPLSHSDQPCPSLQTDPHPSGLPSGRFGSAPDRPQAAAPTQHRPQHSGSRPHNVSDVFSTFLGEYGVGSKTIIDSHLGVWGRVGPDPILPKKSRKPLSDFPIFLRTQNTPQKMEIKWIILKNK